MLLTYKTLFSLPLNTLTTAAFVASSFILALSASLILNSYKAKACPGVRLFEFGAFSLLVIILPSLLSISSFIVISLLFALFIASSIPDLVVPLATELIFIFAFWIGLSSSLYCLAVLAHKFTNVSTLLNCCCFVFNVL